MCFVPFAQMAKVSPASLASVSDTSSSSTHNSSEREVYTIWMKSLVLNGNGCTVYDSEGKIVHRVDNYDSKGCRKVYLMDNMGNVLLKIVKKRLRIFGRWEGHRTCTAGLQHEAITPWFKVKRPCGFPGAAERQLACELCSGNSSYLRYHINGFSRNLSCKIVDVCRGIAVAEVKRKHTTTGIELGDDVFTLEVHHNTDHSLIMGLVIVYALVNQNM